MSARYYTTGKYSIKTHKPEIHSANYVFEDVNSPKQSSTIEAILQNFAILLCSHVPESQEDFLLCKVLQQMFCTCHSQLKVKNLLLRKAKILQNAKIARQPSCITRFYQLLSDLNINIKQKSFHNVTHETSLSVMRQRAH